MIDGPGMSVTFYIRPDEIELKLNAGIGIIAGLSKEQARQLLTDVGGYVSRSTQEYLLGHAEEQGLI